MINSNLINSRIDKLRKYIKILEKLEEEKREDFKKDYRIYGLAERYLHLSIECILDIGNHIISTKDLEKPETYRDIILVLGKESVIPKDFSLKIAKMA